MRGIMSGSGKAFISGEGRNGLTKSFIYDSQAEGSGLSPAKGVSLGMMFFNDPSSEAFEDLNFGQIQSILRAKVAYSNATTFLPIVQDRELPEELRSRAAKIAEKWLGVEDTVKRVTDQLDAIRLANGGEPAVRRELWDFDQTCRIAEQAGATQLLKLFRDLRQQGIF
jgi:hypothetical protein